MGIKNTYEDGSHTHDWVYTGTRDKYGDEKHIQGLKKKIELGTEKE